MGFIIVFFVVIVVAVLVVPSYWVKYTLKKHHNEREDFPGDAGEFAVHLIKRLKIEGVSVENTADGDHYDPTKYAVRLSDENINSKSLTAIVVAAHEVGHAMQHHSGYKLLLVRTRLAMIFQHLEKLGSVFFVLIPILMFLTKIPALGAIMFLVSLVAMSSSIILSLITLPVEFDASFKRALPVLKQGNYLSNRDLNTARTILFACAMTYISASLFNLLNLWRWIQVLKR
ncbi:MAG: zinc metallopeptidase [Methylococcales bacterium]|jgi:uncharacterized protein|nr:zinc metallopeptidase [Methylococcales bacterium]